ncbi:hypothetical protein LIER_28481 [Lithospermum erythrorhizon]|uniref:Uncharacterized protein n=1 Tax=Lithospermum erythrorhizon TaxID=34254 RepID=A0AAV3RLT8_LITER
MPKSTAAKPLRDGVNAVEEPLDHLLLVHSNLSSLIHQIDELVVQALQLSGEKDRKEIQAFADGLAEMQVSLKPYIKRFHETLSSSTLLTETNSKQSSPKKSALAVNEDASTSICSPEETKWESLVSPSPLVSWRPNSNVDGSRHLFLLTPLPLPKPFSSKCQKSVKSLFEKPNMGTTVQPLSLFNIEENAEDILMKEDMTQQKTPRKVPISNTTSTDNNLVSPQFSIQRKSMLFATPRLKTSPPKSCVLLEPVPELRHKFMNYKSTPFPRGNQNSHLSENLESPTSSGHQCADDVKTRFGVNERNRRRVFEESPKWLMTPPKTCVLLELPKEKSLTSAANLQQTALFTDRGNKLPPLNEQIDKKNDAVMAKSCNKDPGRTSALIECTPLWREPESNLQTGKWPGENTLKRELWVKFEAATSQGCRFLDLLEEVSCDEQSPTDDR